MEVRRSILPAPHNTHVSMYEYQYYGIVRHEVVPIRMYDACIIVRGASYRRFTDN